MKYLLLALLVGCARNTEHGKCIGVTHDEDPKLVYEYSVRNIVIGVIFSELLVPPALVVFDSLKCPVGKKAGP